MRTARKNIENRHDSRQKGKRGELELAEYLREFGFTARRSQQYRGTENAQDLVHSVPGVHLECKRGERARPYEWLAKTIDEAIDGLIPVIAHRQNRQEWIAILPLADLLLLLKR